MGTQPRPRHWPPPTPPARPPTPPPVPPGLAALDSLKAANGEGIDDLQLGGNVGEFVAGGEPVTGGLERPVIPPPPWKTDD